MIPSFKSSLRLLACARALLASVGVTSSSDGLTDPEEALTPSCGFQVQRTHASLFLGKSLQEAKGDSCWIVNLSLQDIPLSLDLARSLGKDFAQFESLKLLRFSKVTLTEATAAALFGAATPPTLQQLEMDSNGMGVPAMESLSGFLAKLTFLKTLGLANQATRAPLALVEALGDLPHLKTLLLGNLLSGSCAEEFGHSLEVLSKLKVLNLLDHNAGPGTCFVPLAKALKKSPSLEVLTLRSQIFKTSSLMEESRALCSALKKMPHLKKLDIIKGSGCILDQQKQGVLDMIRSASPHCRVT